MYYHPPVQPRSTMWLLGGTGVLAAAQGIILGLAYSGLYVHGPSAGSWTLSGHEALIIPAAVAPALLAGETAMLVLRGRGRRHWGWLGGVAMAIGFLLVYMSFVPDLVLGSPENIDDRTRIAWAVYLHACGVMGCWGWLVAAVAISATVERETPDRPDNPKVHWLAAGVMVTVTALVMGVVIQASGL